MTQHHRSGGRPAHGVWYLGIAVTALGLQVLLPQVFVPGDPADTLARLVDHPQLARTAVVVELLVVVTQALAAAGFHRLFRSADAVAAAGVAAFGLVNAVVILGAAATTATAVDLADARFGDAASMVHLLYLVHQNLWSVGALFFGLWLIPMGRCVLTSGWMPRALGWLLVAGGVGYLLAAAARYLADAGGVADALALPATAAELWMIGYLLVRGVRRSSVQPDHAVTVSQVPGQVRAVRSPGRGQAVPGPSGTCALLVFPSRAGHDGRRWSSLAKGPR